MRLTVMCAEQEKASKKIAELESMKAIIDQERTPIGKGIEGSGSSRLSSVKDELKAQLSSIKAGLAQSFENERESDDIGGAVRNKLKSLHEAISQVARWPSCSVRAVCIAFLARNPQILTPIDCNTG